MTFVLGMYMVLAFFDAFTCTDAYTCSSYGTSWMTMLRNQDVVSENHYRFASKLTAISDDISMLVRDAEQNRRQTRDVGFRLEKSLLDAENSVERARSRFDSAAEDLERVMLFKQGDVSRASDTSIGTSSSKRTLGMPFAKGGLFKTKNPQQMVRHESEFRIKKGHAHETLCGEAQSAQTKRQEYFQQQLPQVLRGYKESLDELETGVQFQLVRYAFLYENIALSDGVSINPLGDKTAPMGLRDAAASINNQADFKDFMQNFELAFKGSSKETKTPHRENPYDELTLANIMHQSVLPAPQGGTSTGTGAGVTDDPYVPTRPVFGVDLETQMLRDGVEAVSYTHL